LVDAGLVARRWTQRRAVRTLPDWIVLDIVAQVDLHAVRALDDHSDRTLMEIHLRDLADRFLGQLRLTLDALADANLTFAAQRFYAIAGDADIELLRVERQRVENEPGAARFVHCDRELSALEDIDHDGLRAFVTSVAWADELAGDHRDPRIPIGLPRRREASNDAAEGSLREPWSR
jgi:hypothetical protein